MSRWSKKKLIALRVYVFATSGVSDLKLGAKPADLNMCAVRSHG